MSFMDFCRCTPEQFTTIHNAWAETLHRAERTAWETARFEATCALQPHSKKQLKFTDLLRFTWEADTPQKIIEKSTREDFERAKQLYGG